MKKQLCRKLVSFCFLLAIHSATYSQLSYSMNTLSDGNGNPILTKKAVVGESTYLFSPDYLNAVLTLATGKSVMGSKFKLNLQKNKLFYKDDSGTELEVATPITRIEFLPAPGKEASVVFEKNFPAIEKQTPDNFYMVLVDGKAKLLMDTKFDEVEYKEYNSALTAHRTDKLYTYYGVMGNAIAKITRPDDLLLLLSDKTQQISDYIKKENIKIKKQSDLEKVFQYYNSISK